MHTTLQQALESVPDGGPVLFGGLWVAGLALWLLGGRLAHLACGLMGLAVGAAAASLLAWILALEGVVMLPILVLGAVLGAVLSVALFRAWVALCSAVTLAALLPVAVLLWEEGAAPPAPPVDTVSAAVAAPQALGGEPAPGVSLHPAAPVPSRGNGAPVASLVPANGEMAVVPAPSSEEPGVAPLSPDPEGGSLEQVLRQSVEDAAQEKMHHRLEEFTESIRSAVPPELRDLDEQGPLLPDSAASRLTLMLNHSRDTAGRSWQGVREVWKEMGVSEQTIFVLSAAVGGALGLMLGLITPTGMSAGLAAVAGSLMWLSGGYRLLHPLMPQQAESLFATPRGLVLTVGLIILTGLAIQWTILRKWTDQ